jgi:aminopeptidase N
MVKPILLILILILGTGNLFSQCDLSCYHADPDSREREHSVDITHMKVEVSFDVNDPKGGKVIGKVTHHFEPLRAKVDTLFFDGPGIQINSATLDGKTLKFKTNTQGVTVYFNPPLSWDKKHQIEFDYTAYPRKGLFFIGWDRPEYTGPADMFRIRRQIWTQGQGIDHRNWIPMYDNMNDKFTTETLITFDEQYKVLSNGKLMSNKKSKDKTNTWHYKLDKPHAGYLLMLAIGKYDIKSTKTKRGIPVHFWYYPEFKDRVEYSSMHTERMIDFLEEETGYPYPWGEYSQVMVQDFLYGAMENTTATIFGDFFNVDKRAFEDRNYIGVNCHELTHQWFGDLITARASNDIWMQENFATFYAKWFFGDLPGYNWDEVKWNQIGEFNSALKAAEKDNYPIRHTKGGTPRAYPKGSSALQMLRSVISDEAFKRSVKLYLETHAFQNVEAADFFNAFKDKLGMNLDWFFDQWFLRGGEPHYKIYYHTTKSGTLINVEQIHKTDMVIGTFKMPVNIGVYYKDGSYASKRCEIENHFETFLIPNPAGKEISFVVFDENWEILKKTTFERTPEELTQQALKAQNMADRYEAVLALSQISIDKKRTSLEQILESKSEFYAVKNEAWKQWLKANSNSSTLPVMFAPKEHRAVRQTWAQHLNPMNHLHRKALEDLLTDSSYQVIETALDNLFGSTGLRSNPEFGKMAENWLAKTKDIIGMNYAVRVKWLEYSLSYSGSLRVDIHHNLSTELVNLCSPDFEFRTRVNAMEAIKRMNFYHSIAIDHIIEAIYKPNGRLAGPASSVLQWFYGQNQYKAEIDSKISDLPEHKRKVLKEKGY